ncbi:diphthine synthase [Candidatus Woesearchaeota archaeon]|nr:diphthine synthase [Candidatus Woesearchaeota archaeon]
MLTIIGAGVEDHEDITIKGLHALQKADTIYIESYTSVLQEKLESLEKSWKVKMTPAYREDIEGKNNKIIEKSKTENVALLIIGDPLTATTHTDILLRARKEGIKTRIIHNTGIITLVGETGLQLYKFGKTTSIPFDEKGTGTAYNIIAQNQSIKAHTLILLDLDPLNNKYLEIPAALQRLLIEEKKHKKRIILLTTKIVVCERLGTKTQKIYYETIEKVLGEKYGKPPHCIIIPTTLHFMEEEYLNSAES